MTAIVYILMTVVMAFFLTISSADLIEASTKPVFHDSEHGSIKLDHGQYLKPKYVHEPIQLHVSGDIEDYQRSASTHLLITLPSGDVVENVIRPTRDGEFDFTSQITSNHASGQYEIHIAHKEMTLGPAMFSVVMGIENQNEMKSQNIPDWIKNNAGWWSQGIIGDNDFVEGVQYMINRSIIKVTPIPIGTETGSNEIPDWIKNNAGWWSQGQITNNDFLKGIQYLVEQGIIKLA